MYFRESSMPAQDDWEALFDIELILDRFGFSGDVAELGCGYGTFTLPIARRTQGIVHSVDIDPSMVETVRRRAAEQHVANVIARVRDAATAGFGLPDSSCDACLLFNILHCESPVELMREARRVLRPGGTLAVIHWRSDIATPRGPPLDIRPTPPMILEWARNAGALDLSDGPFTLPPWHFGVAFTRA
jgi:SAM-dependent methyltransferase